MIPVVLILMNNEDVELLKRGLHKKKIKGKHMIRMTEEAFQ